MLAKFWVIFDTCTYAQYYQDVHNLLALPDRATMRYDYKSKYLSDAAIELAKSSEQLPILFFYAQKRTEYLRDKDKSKPGDANTETIFIATRIGRMLSVPNDAQSYYFDFEVTRYPRQDAEHLDRILTSLKAAGEVPWNKWVCVSTQVESFEAIQGGDEQQKWVAIVDLLAKPPIQFVGDAFWRIKGPFEHSGESANLPQIEYYTEAGRSRQARSYYGIPENSSWRFELTSEAGKGAQARAQYEVEGKSSDDKVLGIFGSGRYRLRHYTGQMIEYRAQSAPMFGQAAADLTLNTAPQHSEWSVGPNITLRHKLRRSKTRITFGIIIGVVGTFCFVLGDSKVFEQRPWIGTIFKAGGIVLIVLSGVILTGKVTFKPGG